MLYCWRRLLEVSVKFAPLVKIPTRRAAYNFAFVYVDTASFQMFMRQHLLTNFIVHFCA